MNDRIVANQSKSLSENMLAPFLVVISAALVLMGVMVGIVFAQRLDNRLDRFQQAGLSSAAVSPADRLTFTDLESDVATLQIAALIAGGVGLFIVYLGLLYIVWAGWKSTTMRRILLEAANSQLEERVEERVAELREANERLQTEVQQREKAESEVQRSRQRIASAEEGLRKEIAEVLHGKVQTSLLVAWHRLGESVALLDRKPDEAKAAFIEIRDEIDRIREREVREVSHTLHPSVIRVGLLPAVRALLESYESDFSVALSASDEVAKLDDVLDNQIAEPIRLIAYRVLQESISNVQRHAEAEKILVTLGLVEDRQLLISIKDNGKGFKPGTIKYGLGLNSIADRVAIAGGSWSIESSLDAGTTLTVQLPSEQSSNQNEDSSLIETPGPD
ncbi:MAG: hypothetical protein O2854_00725 [Chloroflexi bacterium]|nr:hypothetical protein [Chloroflexota bacterium]